MDENRRRRRLDRPVRNPMYRMALIRYIYYPIRFVNVDRMMCPASDRVSLRKLGFRQTLPASKTWYRRPIFYSWTRRYTVAMLYPVLQWKKPLSRHDVCRASLIFYEYVGPAYNCTCFRYRRPGFV